MKRKPKRRRWFRRKNFELSRAQLRELIIYVWVTGLVLGMLAGGLLLVKCPKVIVFEDHCCMDENLNSVCDGQENETTVVVRAAGEGDVVVVSGFSISEKLNGTTVSSSVPVTPTTIANTATTSAPVSTTTTIPGSQADNETDDSSSSGDVEESCDNVDLSIYRVVYKDGEESYVAMLARNHGQFDIRRWRVKVYDEEHGLALQNRFWKRLNASTADELRFEFGDNNLVTSDNDVVKVKITVIIGEEVCEEFTALGDMLDTKN